MPADVVLTQPETETRNSVAPATETVTEVVASIASDAAAAAAQYLSDTVVPHGGE